MGTGSYLHPVTAAEVRGLLGVTYVCVLYVIPECAPYVRIYHNRILSLFCTEPFHGRCNGKAVYPFSILFSHILREDSYLITVLPSAVCHIRLCYKKLPFPFFINEQQASVFLHLCFKSHGADLIHIAYVTFRTFFKYLFLTHHVRSDVIAYDLIFPFILHP